MTEEWSSILNTTDLDEAKDYYRLMGGWLLNMGGGAYLATEDEGIVFDIRGKEFIDSCEDQQCWDETDPNFRFKDDSWEQ